MVAIERNGSKFYIEQGKFCRHSSATAKNLTQFQCKICPLQPICNRRNNSITHDPYVLQDYDPDWKVDFGAEKIIAAERNSQKTAVEAKSYLGLSFAYEFHQILGQHLNYRAGLKRL